MAKHDKAIEALTEAIGLVTNLHQGGSFIQLKSKIEKVTQKLKDFNHLREFDAFGPMIESLVEMSITTASGDAVGQILAVLRELRGKIEAQRAAGDDIVVIGVDGLVERA